MELIKLRMRIEAIEKAMGIVSGETPVKQPEPKAEPAAKEDKKKSSKSE